MELKNNATIERIENYLELLPARELLIAQAIVFESVPEVKRKTIADKYHISRERVRQLQARIRKDLSTILTDDRTVDTYVTTITSKSLTSIAHVYDQFPELHTTIKHSHNSTYLQVLSKITGKFDIKDEWTYGPTYTTPQEYISDAVKKASNKYGVCDLEELHKEGITLPTLQELGYVVYGNKLLSNTTSANNHAAAILSIEGEDRTADFIYRALHRDITKRSLMNSLVHDPRIIRIQKDSWGLKEWGQPEYSNLTHAIKETIIEHGGSIGRTKLTEILVTSYGVTPTSVSNNLYTGSFTLEGDTVTINKTIPTKKPRTKLETTKHMYRTKEGWALRRIVNTDHLRGSGSHLPIAIDHLLHLPMGGTATFASPEGEVVAKWNGTQIFIGSIKKNLDAKKLKKGDIMVMKFTDDASSFTIDKVNTSASGLDLILEYMGTSKTGATLEDIAFSLSLEESSVEAIETCLLSRKETDLLEKFKACL